MPNLDQKGPGSLGPKTEKKLGECRKSKIERKEIEEIYFYKKGSLDDLSTIKFSK